MKALKLLKHAFKGYSVHEKDIQEAISELEEIQNRSCSNCKAYIKGTYSMYCAKLHDVWSKGEMYQPDFGKKFCCNKYEPKEKE